MSELDSTESITVHPYADEFPMASEDELAELAASIAAVGQGVPGVIAATVGGVEDGRLVDGRNRRKACEMAGVEFMVRTQDFASDDELKEFIIGINTAGRRESMTVQIAAASVALILGAEKRKNGRWVRNTHTCESASMDATTASVLSRCGLVLDMFGPDALRAIRDGENTLNAAYQAAQDKRQADADAEAAARAEEEAEESARQFMADNDPEAEIPVDGENVRNWREAKALWEQRNRERAQEIAREKAMRAAAKQEALNRWNQACDGLRGAISYAKTYTPPEDTDIYPKVEWFQQIAAELTDIATTWEAPENE